MDLFFDKDGTPLPTLEWARKFEDYDYRFVGHDFVGAYRVSTLWMGMPPVGLHVSRPPLVFQTAVFHHREPLEERNYATEADALAGHEAIVTLLRATVVESPEGLLEPE
jgi:hypothetical protein